MPGNKVRLRPVQMNDNCLESKARAPRETVASVRAPMHMRVLCVFAHAQLALDDDAPNGALASATMAVRSR